MLDDNKHRYNKTKKRKQRLLFASLKIINSYLLFYNTVLRSFLTYSKHIFSCTFKTVSALSQQEPIAAFYMFHWTYLPLHILQNQVYRNVYTPVQEKISQEDITILHEYNQVFFPANRQRHIQLLVFL